VITKSQKQPRITCCIKTQELSKNTPLQPSCFTLNPQDGIFKVTKGYHMAQFTLPQFQGQSSSLLPDQTMILYGYKGTGKSSLLRRSIQDYLKERL
ncbi:MAG: hypothetical protein ACK56F_33260, partial [bacterium]